MVQNSNLLLEIFQAYFIIFISQPKLYHLSLPFPFFKDFIPLYTNLAYDMLTLQTRGGNSKMELIRFKIVVIVGNVRILYNLCHHKFK